MTDLATTYMGLRLRNPLVASASPLSRSVEGVRRLAGAGVAAVVLPSVFEEELEAEARRRAALVEAGSERVAEAVTYFPAVPARRGGAARHVSLVERAAVAVGVPVIASVNGVTPGGWTGYARQLQDAGAAAIELNLPSVPGPGEPGRDVERRHVEIVHLVKAAVQVPVAVKLSPHYSSIGATARELAAAGADGLVLFNRFLHPDVDHEALAVVPGLGLSQPGEARLPRTWIALLRRRLGVSLAASTGVEDAGDVARYLLAGADVVTTASALLRHGPEHAATLLAGLADWMARKGFRTVGEVRGLLAAPAVPDEDAGAAERAGYVAALRAADATVHGPW